MNKMKKAKPSLKRPLPAPVPVLSTFMDNKERVAASSPHRKMTLRKPM